MIEYTDNLTVELCQANPAKIFVFGDNLAGTGMAGQACIRKQPNAFGIPTKRYPSTHAGAYFSDQACERNHVISSLRELYSLGRRSTIVFPRNGVGAGMAKMPTKSPLIYSEMCEILLKHFGIRNE